MYTSNQTFLLALGTLIFGTYGGFYLGKIDGLKKGFIKGRRSRSLSEMDSL